MTINLPSLKCRVKIYEVYYELFEDILRAELLNLGGIGTVTSPCGGLNLSGTLGAH